MNLDLYPFCLVLALSFATAVTTGETQRALLVVSLCAFGALVVATVAQVLLNREVTRR